MTAVAIKISRPNSEWL